MSGRWSCCPTTLTPSVTSAVFRPADTSRLMQKPAQVLTAGKFVAKEEEVVAGVEGTGHGNGRSKGLRAGVQVPGSEGVGRRRHPLANLAHLPHRPPKRVLH